MNVMKEIALDNLDVDMDFEDKKEEWCIKNDLQADWCLDMIREYQNEYKRFKDVVEVKIAQLEGALEAEKRKAENEISFFKTKLAEYFETVPKQQAKTQESYKLPSGKLVKKYKQPQFKRNNAELVKWLEKNKMDNLVKLEKKANWAELKRKAKIVKGRVIYEDTGEVISGVKAIPRNPEFRVEV